MTTYAERKMRLSRAGQDIDKVIRQVSDGRSSEEVAELVSKIYGKPVGDMPTFGSKVLVTDLFAGSDLFGVEAEVTSDTAMYDSGVKWAKRRVMVRFSKPVVGRRQFFPFPVAALAVVTEDK